MKKLFVLLLFAIVFFACDSDDVYSPNKDIVEKHTSNSEISKTTASYKINFECKDQKGNYISDLYIYVDDGHSCLFSITKKGKATVKTQSKKIQIMVYDKKKRKSYGVIAKKYSSASSTIKLQMPRFPKNKTEAGTMMDNLVMGINIANMAFDLKDLYNLLKKIKGYGAGVPGVFSIDIIPNFDSNGKLGLGISGFLTQEVFKYYPVINGKYNYYKDKKQE